MIASARSLNRQQGFTLTEVMVALGLFVFALTTLMTVIPFGMDQVRNASNESRGIGFLEAIREDAGLTLSAGGSTTPRFEIPVPTDGNPADIHFLLGEDGERVTGRNATFRVRGTFRTPTSGTRGPAKLHLRASWPANAPPGRESGSVELIAAFPA